MSEPTLAVCGVQLVVRFAPEVVGVRLAHPATVAPASVKLTVPPETVLGEATETVAVSVGVFGDTKLVAFVVTVVVVAMVVAVIVTFTVGFAPALKFVSPLKSAL